MNLARARRSPWRVSRAAAVTVALGLWVGLVPARAQPPGPNTLPPLPDLPPPSAAVPGARAPERRLLPPAGREDTPGSAPVYPPPGLPPRDGRPRPGSIFNPGA